MIELITEDQASIYLDGKFYGDDEISLYNFHFPYIFLIKDDVTIDGDLDMNWYENIIKDLASYEFGLIIIDGNLNVDGSIQYDRGIPILYVTGEIKSNNETHTMWEY